MILVAATYTLQWKLASGVFATITGITTNSYALPGLVPCSIYNFQVLSVCSASLSSAYSTTASFITAGCLVTYCTSNGTNSTYEFINRVALGTINNTSGNNNGYGNYTAQSTNLVGNTINTITLVPGYVSNTFSEAWNVWIDYNRNGVFTDAGEKVATGSGLGTITKSFTIPTTALNGSTRMRIQMKYRWNREPVRVVNRSW